jgi:predicted nucleic acid-binding protein
MIRSGAEFAGRLVLDTSAYSHFRAADERVLDLIAAADIVFLPTIVLGELEAGFVLGRRERENRTLLAEFLAEPFVSVLPVTGGVSTLGMARLRPSL